MNEHEGLASLSGLARVPTGVPGLDAVTDGGFLAGDAYLVIGAPGTGKTTLGNQLAFAHAARGGAVLFATLLTETHERMLAHLSGFRFVDPELVGERVRYLSVLQALEEAGLDGVLEALRRGVREHGAGLLVVDGTVAAEELVGSGFDYGRFVQGLQARLALLGCTTVLLSSGRTEEAGALGTHVDGVVELSLEGVEARDIRWLRIAKLRGSAYLGGRHRFVIDERGIAVYPRIEAALAGVVPTHPTPSERVGIGVAGLDAMLDGGLLTGSSTVVMGTPGAGKTILALHFLAEGARRGESGVIASFHETAPLLAATADAVGLGLGRHVESGAVRVMWQAPLEGSPDAWAWDLLRLVDDVRPRRLVVDALSDLNRLFAVPQRQVAFVQALANELRTRGITALFNLEIDSFASQELVAPIPSVSAAFDNGILLRTGELRSRVERLVSVLKTRQSGFDPTIRRCTIGEHGIVLGEPFGEVAGLLTGDVRPGPGTS